MRNCLNGDSTLADKVGLKDWIYGPGLPDNCPIITTDALADVERQAKLFADSGDAASIDAKGWSTHQWLHFLRSLPKPLPTEQLRVLDATFRLNANKNSEITFDWLMHAVAANYQPAMPRLRQFLTTQGRRKFLRPLYEQLATTPDGMKRANEIYQEARPTYHAISVATIDELLKWSP